MNIPFALGINIIAITTSVIAYANYPHITQIDHVENWIRDILCITTITLALISVIITTILYYVLNVLKRKKINNSEGILIFSTVLICYCAWDLLTRNELIEERQTIRVLTYIFIFIVVIDLISKG